MQGEQFLKTFHDASPGETPQFMEMAKTIDGRSSYEVLLDEVARSNGTILDLACGDGHLLELLKGQNREARDLLGIDMSRGELSLAKNRSSLNGVKLILGNARALTIGSESVSAVTCHMALMLMPKVHEILREVSRVLKPEGIFAAFINIKSPPNEVGALLYSTLERLLTREQLAVLESIRDARLDKLDEIKTLFTNSGFSNVRTEDIVLKYYATPEELYSHFEKMYYRPFFTPEQKSEFKNDLILGLSKLTDPSGKIVHDRLFRLFVAVK